jgi:hypothetical protein
MINRSYYLLTSALLLSFAAPSLGHHSFAAVFDATITVDVTGTVTEVEWMNPHAWIHLDVNNGDGEVERWSFELGSPNGLIRRGWSRGTIKPGDEISVSGYRARDGSLRGNVKSVVLATGQQLDGMSSRPAAD